MITLKQIRYALAVERHLQFKSAADECNVSQSTLSGALQEMESLLGFQVFERDNRKVLVTPLGVTFLEKARHVDLEMRDISSLADATREPLCTKLSIGLIPTVAPFLLPLVLPRLRAAYPELELSVTEAESSDLVGALHQGKLDTAVIALPFPIDGLLTFSFASENLVWVAHRDQVQPGLSVASRRTITSSNLMLLEDGHCLKDHALSACGIQSAARDSFSATSLFTLIELVKSGLGSTLLPELAVKTLIAGSDEFRVVPLPDPGPHRELALAIRPNYPGLANIEALRQVMREAVLDAKD